MSQSGPKKMSFLNNSSPKKQRNLPDYKILIADDEEEIHRVTKFVLKNFKFNGRGLTFLDTYSGEETCELLSRKEDIAVLLLDVVMEKNNSGLMVAEYLRKDLGNQNTRIILRTGEPGEAPEEEIIRDYDINDYRLKTELTSRRLATTLYSALRNYRDLMRLEEHKKGLEKIITASSSLFNQKNLDDFLNSILNQLASFQKGADGMVFMNRDESDSTGVISQISGNQNRIIAATGKYAEFNGQPLDAVPGLAELNHYLKTEHNGENSPVRKLNSGMLVIGTNQNLTQNYIYIEGEPEGFDLELTRLFLTHFSIALNNLILSNMVQETQEEVLYVLAGTVDSHFGETGEHVKRVAGMMQNFALKLHFGKQEAEMIRLASTMHDVGKIAISDTILKKPGKLTVEEFEIIKTHPRHGYDILNASDLPVLKQAASIALSHHEKYDGSGYPSGLSGNDTPLTGRMMAIVDVFDALGNKRCYKEAMPREEVIAIIEKDSGSHFDPSLTRVFLENLEEILI